ncbi:MAG: MFS transporter [Negativicutes bacterium]|nr:MFS transporter [Negativicutes bacterium]
MDPRNTKMYRFGVVALLTAGTFINAVDRASLSIAVPSIIKEFGIDTATMGFALSAFFWAYAIGNAPGGNLADKYGTKKVLGWAAAIWSVFSALTGAATNVFHIMVARFGVGIGEAASLPTSAKIIASNFPSQERGTAVAVAWTGIRIGNAATPILMAFLVANYGWRAAFIITGLGSLLWVVLWYFSFTDLSETQAKEAGIKEKIKVPWKVITTNRTLIGLTVVKFTQDFLQWLFLTWVPGYLVMGRGFSVITMGFYVSLSYAVAAICQPLVGYMSDWLIKQGWSVSRARKTVQVTLQLLASTIIITGYTDSVPIAMFFMVVAISAESICAGHMWTLMTEVVPPRLVGSVGGLINSIGSAAGIFSPIVTGIIVKVTGSFTLALLMGGCSILLAAVVLLVVVPELKILQELESKIPQLAQEQTKG